MICIVGILLITLVSAEKLSLQIGKLNNDVINFKVIVYDDNNNKIDGEASYIIQDPSETNVDFGKANSGEEVNFKLPKNPSQGLWKINASYNGKSVNELFNVGDIMRADIRLEKDNLIIENTGNVAYNNKILITIGDALQSQPVYLAIGETRTLRLTAPAGEYTVKVDDGSGNDNLVFNSVTLTGNVIGMENVIQGNFWQKYGILSTFLVILFIVSVIVGSRIKKINYGKVKRKKK